MNKKIIASGSLLLFILSIAVIIIVFATRQAKVDEYIRENHLKPTQLEPSLLNTTDLVKLDARSAYNISQGVIEVQLINSSDQEYTYGYGYDLEIYAKGIWYTVPLNENSIFPLVALFLPANSSVSLQVDLESHIPLLPGKYRIVQMISEVAQPQTAVDYIVTEFTLK